MAVSDLVSLNSSLHKEAVMDGKKNDDAESSGPAGQNACCKELAEKLDKSESGRKKLRQAISMLKEKLESTENVLQVNAALQDECEKAQQRLETERRSLEEERRLQKISEQEGKSLKEELFRATERIHMLENNEKEDRLELKRLQEEVKEAVGLVRVAVKHLESAQCSEENLSAKVNDVSAQSLKSYSLAQSILSTASSAQNAAKKSEATVLSVQKQTQSLSSRLGILQKQGTRLEQSVTFLRQQLQKKPPVNQEAFKGQSPSNVLSAQHTGRHVSRGMVLSKNQCGNDESSIGADQRQTNGSFIEVIPGIGSILNPVLSDNAAKPSANGSQKSSMLSSQSNVLDLECSSKWDTIKCKANGKGTHDSVKDFIDLKEVQPSNEHCSRKTEAMCCPKVLTVNGNHCTKPIETITTDQNLAHVCTKEINPGPYLKNQVSPVALLESLSRHFKDQRKAQHKIKANLSNLKKVLLSCPANTCLNNQCQYSSGLSSTLSKSGAIDGMSTHIEKQEHQETFIIEGRHKDKKRRKANFEMIPNDGQHNGLFQVGLEEKITESSIPKQGFSKEHEDEALIHCSIKTLDGKGKIGIEELEIQHKKEVACSMEDVQKLDGTSDQRRDLHNLVVRRQKDEVGFEGKATESEGNGDVLFAESNENQPTGTSFRPSDLCCNLFEYRASDWETDSFSSDEDFGEELLADLPLLLSPDLPVIPPPASGMILHTAGDQDCNMDSDEDLR